MSYTIRWCKFVQILSQNRILQFLKQYNCLEINELNVIFLLELMKPNLKNPYKVPNSIYRAKNLSVVTEIDMVEG